MSRYPKLVLAARDFHGRTASALEYLQGYDLPVQLLRIAFYEDTDGRRLIDVRRDAGDDDEERQDAGRRSDAGGTTRDGGARDSGPDEFEDDAGHRDAGNTCGTCAAYQQCMGGECQVDPNSVWDVWVSEGTAVNINEGGTGYDDGTNEPDPYVRVSLGSRESETGHQEDTLEPYFNEMVLEGGGSKRPTANARVLVLYWIKNTKAEAVE